MNGAAIHLDPPATWPTGQNITHEFLRVWVRACDAFLNWQRQEIIEKDPPPEKLAEHRDALKWMLRLTRILHTQVADPDFPARQFAPKLAGKLLQLEQSWELIQNPMPDAEADAILRTVFPDERRTGSPA